MSLENSIVGVFLVYYMMDLGKTLLFKSERKGRIEVNQRLEELRKIPIRSLEEQKEFINLKNPPRRWEFKKFFKALFTFRGITSVLIYSLTFGVFLYGVQWLFFILHINLKMWQSITFIILFPLLWNWLLKKVNLNKGDDISVFLKW